MRIVHLVHELDLKYFESIRTDPRYQQLILHLNNSIYHPASYCCVPYQDKILLTHMTLMFVIFL